MNMSMYLSVKDDF